MFNCERFLCLKCLIFLFVLFVLQITECRLHSESVRLCWWASTLALFSSSSRVGPPPSVMSNMSLMTRRRLFRKPKLTCSRTHSSVNNHRTPTQHAYILSVNCMKYLKERICCKNSTFFTFFSFTFLNSQNTGTVLRNNTKNKPI